MNLADPDERAELARLREQLAHLELGQTLLRMRLAEIRGDIADAARLLDAHVPTEAHDGNTRGLSARLRQLATALEAA